MDREYNSFVFCFSVFNSEPVLDLTLPLDARSQVTQLHHVSSWVVWRVLQSSATLSSGCGRIRSLWSSSGDAADALLRCRDTRTLRQQADVVITVSTGSCRKHGPLRATLLPSLTAAGVPGPGRAHSSGGGLNVSVALTSTSSPWIGSN